MVLTQGREGVRASASDFITTSPAPLFSCHFVQIRGQDSGIHHYDDLFEGAAPTPAAILAQRVRGLRPSLRNAPGFPPYAE
jgi:hypothetical protein